MFNFNITKIRNDFPILSQKIYDNPFVYFDNGSTTQKPKVVIDTINELHFKHNSNIHRGVHYLSEQMTEWCELARKNIQNYLNARHNHEIIFTSGVTASINMIAYSFGEAYIKKNDEIIISEMEHHSNIVPWQMMCQRKGAKLKIIPINDRGELLLDEYKKLINSKTKLVAIVHVSNSLGTINPVKEIVAIAHKNNIPVLIDGAQAVQHEKIDVQDIDCDFYAFSGHKICGPTGIGVLYGKERWLNEMPPYQGGGDMIDQVTFEKTTYAELPAKFEAGTPNYIGAIGLGVAIDHLTSIGLNNIKNYEKKLLEYGTSKLTNISGLKLYGNAENKICIFSFLLDNIHHYDVGMILDKMGIAVRVGHHCTQPIWNYCKVEGSIRASLAFYNTFEEIDFLYEALKKIQKMFEHKHYISFKGSEHLNNKTIREIQEEIINEFKNFNSWMDKYNYLIKLGKEFPQIDSKYKTEDNLIKGCQMKTWFHSTFKDGKIFYNIDSMSVIIRGIVALLVRVLSGKKPEDINNADLYFIDKIGLRENFSPVRSNSLWKLVNQMKDVKNLKIN